MGLFSNTATIVAQGSDPGPLGSGALWSETDNQILWRRNDANTDWLEMAQVANVPLTTGTSFPSSPSAGDLFAHTTHESLFEFSGANWTSLPEGVELEDSGTNLDFLELFRRYDNLTDADTNWSRTNTTVQINTSVNRMEWSTNSAEHMSTFDLQSSEALGSGNNASDSTWLLRFKINVTAAATGGVGNKQRMFFGIASDATVSSTTKDFLGLEFNVDNSVLEANAIHADGTTIIGGTRQAFATAVTVKEFWIEIIRTSTTEITIELFNDEFRSSIEKETFAVLDTIVNLRHLWFGTDGLATSGDISGTIDWIMFYDSVTAV